MNLQEDRILGMLDNQRHRMLNSALKRNFKVEYKKYRGDKVERLKRVIENLAEQKLKKEKELMRLLTR